MYIIAGLGNPTMKYDKTRHNVGFDAIDAIAEKYGIRVDNAKFKSLCGSGMIEGEKVLLMKPQTYMNVSGEAVIEAVDYFKIDAEDELIILYDDISLTPGRLRIRKKGSAGGHNGIKSIIQYIQTEKFKRVKIGVGEKPAGWDLADHVLGRFSKEDRVLVDESIKNAVEATALIVQDETDKAANLYN